MSNNLEEILKKKSQERALLEQKNYLASQQKEHEKKKANENKLQFERNQKFKNFTDILLHSTLIGCLIGVASGLIIGFGKGCIRYEYVPPSIDGGDSFYVPFRFIPANLLIFGIIGLIIGFLVGLINGSIKIK